jgi:hypothetical protein
MSIDEMITKTTNMIQFLDPWSISYDYIQNLADLLGTTLASTDIATDLQRRQELLQTVDWYKMKGAYLSVHVISLILGVQFTIYDKYLRFNNSLKY